MHNGVIGSNNPDESKYQTVGRNNKINLLNKGISTTNKTFSKNIIRNEKEGTLKVIDNRTKRENDNEYNNENSNHSDNYIYTGQDVEEDVKERKSTGRKCITESPDEVFTGNSIVHGKIRSNGSLNNRN